MKKKEMRSTKQVKHLALFIVSGGGICIVTIRKNQNEVTSL
jgi:hypothetical protein